MNSSGAHHTKVIRKEAERKEIEREMLLSKCETDFVHEHCTAEVLMDLLRDEENRYCADCEAKGPRWASWNHGVFVCIRCAGIHRKLGVHISKVSGTHTPTHAVCCCTGEIDQSRLMDTRTGAIDVLHG
jgi:hypothetical protein